VKVSLFQIGLLLSPTVLMAQVAVTTQHNDVNRTGANTSETVLNTSNVNSTTFGKVFARNVDGQIYAQPLYLSTVIVPNKGVHNVVYVATEHDTVFAFDADDPKTSTPLWQTSLGPSVPIAAIGITYSLVPEVGITGTPVIDPSTGTLYAVAMTYEGGVAIFRLHALDVATGAEKFNGPVVIQGSVAGTAPTSTGGVLPFIAANHLQRPGLLLANGNIYIGFGSHEDTLPYQGWIFSYSATTLQQTAINCLGPNKATSGVWQGGVAPAADANGFIYVQAGQGPFDANTGGPDYGDSMVKLNPALGVVDYFAPSNQLAMDPDDADLGSSGPILIPGTSLAVGAGKDGTFYLWNENNLGKYNTAADQVVQEWQGTYDFLTTGDGGIFGGSAFYNNTLYTWGRRDVLKAWAFNGSTFNTTPTSGLFVVPDDYSEEPTISVSGNGNAPGTGIVWSSYTFPIAGGNDGKPHPSILRAFDASNIATELWDSNQNQARDNAGSWAKWDPPTIANGYVYLPTWDNVLNVYGLLASAAGGHLTGVGDSSTATVNLTAEGSSDWEHWGPEGVNRKAGVTAQLSALTASIATTTYQPDPRAISWTDGTPTANSSLNQGGVFVPGIGQKLTITAPAGISPVTVVVHVGGFLSAGKLTAHLSDGSAPDFTDTTTVATGQYDRNYTLTYRAASAGQTLIVTWAMTAGTGNITISAASLDATTITASAGTPQSATAGTTFATGLQAKVTDSLGNGMNGVTVTFTAPGSGASGTFGGSTTAAVTTNASGVAAAPVFTANNQAGAYVVTASATGIGTPAAFSLTNTAATVTGSLAGSVSTSTAAVNLTTEGALDWIHWGDTALNRKAGVTPQLSTYSIIGNAPAIQYCCDPRGVSWTDGGPTTAATNNQNGIFVYTVGDGFSVTAPADKTTRTLILHVGGWESGATLTAHLSDGSAADYTNVAAGSATGQYDDTYTLTYSAASAGQTITVTWKMTSGTNGNVTFNGAALTSAAVGSLSGSVTTSSTAVNLTTEGTRDWIHWGDTAVNRKAGVTAQLSTYTTIGTAPVTISTDLRPVSWTDGTPTATASSNMNDVFVYGIGNGFSLTAPADTTSRKLVVHVSGWNGAGTLAAHLSDGSAADYTNTAAGSSGQYDGNYTLTYNAGSPGQTLTVTWTLTAGTTGHVSVQAAALQ
jgi:hypothetical protein